ncbi:putative reverse transcriptase domain-containing protein [Tanacetum coccineum]
MHQGRWIELFSDYDCEICYHPRKENVVVDALSRKERVKLRRIRAMCMTIQSGVKDKILVAQMEATKLENAPAKILRGLDQLMEVKEDGGLYFMDQIWVPLVGSVRTLIMDKAHTTSKGCTSKTFRFVATTRDSRVEITMDFITKLPISSSGHDTIWVIMDRLTKSAYFLAIREDYSMERLARIYINEVLSRHRVPVSIISDRDGRFTLQFWQTLEKALGAQLDMSRHKYAPFEALYGRECRSPILWTEIRESRLIGPEMVQETTDKPLEFSVGDQVLLKVSPWKGVVRFGKKAKLASRYVGPFAIIEWIGPIAYRLRLPQELSSVHDTLHVSNLKKCLADANLHVPLDEIKVDKTLCFVKEPMEIMDREVKRLKHSKILIVKVHWNSKIRGNAYPCYEDFGIEGNAYPYYVDVGSGGGTALPRKEYERVFMSETAKERGKVTAIKEAKDLATLPLDELNAKVTREQTSDDSDSQGGSNEDVDEEEAEAFNLMERNLRKFFHKDKYEVVIIAGKNVTSIVSIRSLRRTKLLSEELEVIVKTVMNLKMTQLVSWLPPQEVQPKQSISNNDLDIIDLQKENKELLSKVNELELELKKLTKSKE